MMVLRMASRRASPSNWRWRGEPTGLSYYWVTPPLYCPAHLPRPRVTSRVTSRVASRAIRVAVRQVLTLPSEEQVRKEGFLPASPFPSDHLSLFARAQRGGLAVLPILGRGLGSARAQTSENWQGQKQPFLRHLILLKWKK